MSTEQPKYMYRVSMFYFDIERFEVSKVTKCSVSPVYHRSERLEGQHHKWFEDFDSAARFAAEQGAKQIERCEREINKIKCNLERNTQRKALDGDALRRNMPKGPLVL